MTTNLQVISKCKHNQWNRQISPPWQLDINWPIQTTCDYQILSLAGGEQRICYDMCFEMVNF
jgi:hypothetical protein